MWNRDSILRCPVFFGVIAIFLFARPQSHAQEIKLEEGQYLILVVKGKVEIARAGAQTFDETSTNKVLYPGDHVRINEDSELMLKNSHEDRFRWNEKSDFEISPPAASPKPGLRLLRGLLHFFHRGPPTDLEILGRESSAMIRGTEFTMEVDAAGATIVTVMDGLVDLSNPQGVLPLTNGQQGVAVPGQKPTLRPSVDVLSVIQWTLYYPGVLDPQELPLTAEEVNALKASITAYRSGDILRALADYPPGRVPQSDAAKIYRAALWLAVGKVDDAQPLLTAVSAAKGQEVNVRLAAALEGLIAVVKQRSAPPARPPELGTEWLVESYRQQSLAHLDEALAATKQAIVKSPQFGFAWERLAELEFSFGRREDASRALSNAFILSPRNAQAVALNGFLYAARNKIRSAIDELNRAIAIDGGLANAWLGRGLCRIRSGDREVGLEDLITAAALEPQRALLRSYLAKAWSDSGKRKPAEHELELAKEFDPRDPTAWLYSALIKQQYNEINDAIRDLEHSQTLSTNRSIYRSEFLLDQDRAVRSANLAHMYRDAGMSEWSVLEARRAVSADYANYSSHLFLANSYDELRDPNRISLRYETPAESEYLIANLLAPVGAGTLSQTISQGEYSKLFERNRLGIVSRTEYLGGAWYQNGAQFGVFGNASYSVEGVYRFDPGERWNEDFRERALRLKLTQQLTPEGTVSLRRLNNDFEERELRLNLKQAFSAADTVYLRLTDYESEGGDRFQYFDPRLSFEEGGPNPGLRTLERQEPTLTLGYHHEFNPDSHFLMAFSRFDDTYQERNPSATFWGKTELNGNLTHVDLLDADLTRRDQSEIYALEAQHIWESPKHQNIIGGRIRWGDFTVHAVGSTEFSQPITHTYFPSFPELPDLKTDFQHFSLYGYHVWRPIDAVALTGGVIYDNFRYPENIETIPFMTSHQGMERFSPKAGLVVTPTDSTAIRFAYTRSLAGVNLDQSIRLEPTQVAGFNQAFRSIVPESIAGANAAARFETYDLSIEQKLEHGTFLAAGAERLYSTIPRTDGAFLSDPDTRGVGASLLHDKVRYRERSLFSSINQLIGRDFVLGTSYRFTDAQYKDQFFEIPTKPQPGDAFSTSQRERSRLHQLELRAIYNHPSGFFTQFSADWYGQDNPPFDPPPEAIQDFWELNVFAGYRFWQRRAQITLGVLNLTGRDYTLNPLMLYRELPRERTFMARLDFTF
jgi:Tfp pilus assembly protein PilF/outer membrane receptor protein involved in Fe transport